VGRTGAMPSGIANVDIVPATEVRSAPGTTTADAGATDTAL
jgi:hypothetical protein